MNVNTGRAGDYIAAAALSRMGVQNVISQQPGFDLVAFVPQPIRIEVKTASKPAVGAEHRYGFITSRGTTKKKRLSSEIVDVVCLVALRERCALFRLVEDITGSNTRVHIKEFTPRNETATWLEVLERLKK